MCFSASASFAAGAALTIIGIATIKKVKRRSQLPFASIPLIFGIQQLSEGVLWLTIGKPEYLITEKIATYVFLFFAQVVWPILIPISIMLLDQPKTRRKLQNLIAGAGFVVGICLGIFLIIYHVDARIIGQHIAYNQEYPIALKSYGIVLYALATIAPPFFSRIRYIWLLGISILISYIITALFYEHYVLSVWCFFASIISISIYGILREIHKTESSIHTI